jgi:PilZ domain
VLEARHDPKLIARLWESTDPKVLLPAHLANFFEPQGAMPVRPDNRRGYHRYFMRGKAILKRNGVMLGSYTKDVSRQGVGFLSPVPLLPLQRVQLQLANGTELHLEVARCRRVDKDCFDCGARFAL